MKRDNPKNPGLLIHTALAQGYTAYVVAIIVGLLLDLAFPIQFYFDHIELAGVLCIVMGSALIFWAQNTSKKTKVGIHPTLTKDIFAVGPYKFTRSPTQYGLFLLVTGLGFLYGAFFLVIASAGALAFGRFVFIRKEEKHLAEKFGAPYLEYKKKVKF